MSENGGPPPGPPPTGDEARRLLDAVQEWAQRTMPAPPSGHGGPECQWCPLCQFASVLRGEHPELTARLTEAGTSLVTALRALLDGAARGAGGEAPAVPQPAERPRPRVQRVVFDDPEPDPSGGG